MSLILFMKRAKIMRLIHLIRNNLIIAINISLVQIWILIKISSRKKGASRQLKNHLLNNHARLLEKEATI